MDIEKMVADAFARNVRLTEGQGIGIVGGWPSYTISLAEPDKKKERPQVIVPPPAPCCLYPFSYDVDGNPLHPPEDLLDAIVVNGNVYTHIAGQYRFEFVVDGTTYHMDAEAGATQWTGIIPETGYAILADCLIGLFGTGGGYTTTVADQFEDHYTVNGTDTITRVDLCTWTGPESLGGTWTLRYDTGAFKWRLTSSNGLPDEYKVDPQDGPVGDYGGQIVA